ncbi:DUF3348 domain-containing protein [Paraburkholderia humisilvae]|uniref:DUF3348 domain-containing protein n=1 Tax=Paraburkholderia humisilvae TaxID=627669 RepID=A0A6J5D7N2_9BURK|nr:DUF3348 domain-containing protein [Paraburkholderia humisilvae]CAB3749112.1 hypothetical protein LMG29542_00878 [Paraburkholderia humisilvae]
MQLPQRMPYSGASLVRVLARVTQTGVPASDVSLPDRLSQWLGWTDAIALSSALDAAAPAPVTGAQTTRGDATVVTLEAARCARTRATLTAAIDAWRRGDAATARRSRGTPLRAEASIEANDATIDFALFRQHYQAQQQSMETAIGELRTRLQATLATRGERHARLALVDATMERALDGRERSLLAAVPTLLETHFTRLRDTALAIATATTTAAAATPQAQHAVAAPPAGAWLDAFREDMHAVLLAELDLRFQPVEGLLAALRAS